MQTLRTALSWIILLAIFATLYFRFPSETKTTAQEVISLFAPCTVPVGYRIGNIDEKFGISRDALQKDLEQASGLWNEAIGKELFKYDPEGTLVVNLEYDSRQEMTERLEDLGVELTVDRASYEQIKLRYDAAFADFASKKSAFESHVAAFDAKKAAYEKDVQYWNGRGGAPDAEYKRLQSEQDAIAARTDDLKREQDALNELAREVNNLARGLNALIDELKLDVHKYNETGQSHGTSFEQGVYERSLGHESITIFEYENNLLLTRVLAHEFGHALGLGHVEDGEAIMYYLNEGDRVALTKADLTELTFACKSPFSREAIMQGVQNIRDSISS